jgi:predicted dehydrogenase|tara:strand:+ start:1672 stop:2673 length:1002 start_codon:yes stop_codon:yes gene_type:complete
MIKWGVIGAGNMGKIFAETIKEVDNAKLIAVASINSKSLDLFSNNFKIKEALRFNNYLSICKNDEIDAIYISTLNNTHFDLIKMCATNKKHILCEKPFCLNLDEALEIKKILIHNNVKFFEAIAYVSHPQTDYLLKLVNDNEIGEIKSIESSFGSRIKKVEVESRLFNKKLGGGVILDIGCYPMSFISLFNNNKKELIFKNIEGEIGKTNVDIAASAEILMNEKINCKIKVSFKEHFKNNSILYGSKGNIKINMPWHPSKKAFLEISNNDRYFKQFIESDLTLYANQIKNVSSEFLNKSSNKYNLFNISKAFENMRYLDYWIKNIKQRSQQPI